MPVNVQQPAPPDLPPAATAPEAPAAPSTPPAPPAPEALLIDDRTAGALLGISRASIHRLRAAGRLPRAIKLGRACRWDRRELEQWVSAGAPALAMWESMKAAGERRRLRAM
jgi:predicted DNA-binding transcriptional regulator AlpA